MGVLGQGLAGQRAARTAAPYDRAVGEAPDYAFPHSAQDESRRLELLEQRLDPLTKQRIQRLGSRQRRSVPGDRRGARVDHPVAVRCGLPGRAVIATDVQVGFLSEIAASNVEVIRHDIRTGTFPPGLFDLIHALERCSCISPPAWTCCDGSSPGWLPAGGGARELRLRHVDRRRRPGMGDLPPDDPGRLPEPGPVPGLVSAPPDSPARPPGGRCRRRDRHHPSRHRPWRVLPAEPGRSRPCEGARGALSLEQATAITGRRGEDDFLACGFGHIGVWGRAAPDGTTTEPRRRHYRRQRRYGRKRSLSALASGGTQIRQFWRVGHRRCAGPGDLCAVTSMAGRLTGCLVTVNRDPGFTCRRQGSHRAAPADLRVRSCAPRTSCVCMREASRRLGK